MTFLLFLLNSSTQRAIYFKFTGSAQSTKAHKYKNFHFAAPFARFEQHNWSSINYSTIRNNIDIYHFQKSESETISWVAAPPGGWWVATPPGGLCAGAYSVSFYLHPKGHPNRGYFFFHFTMWFSLCAWNQYNDRIWCERSAWCGVAADFSNSQVFGPMQSREVRKVQSFLAGDAG